MAEILGGFDANAVEPASVFQCLPAGQYDVIATSMDTYTTNNSKFLAVKMELAVLSGQFQNRKLYVNCLIINRNPSYTGVWDEKATKAMEIGRGRFSALCRAVNVLTPKDTQELVGKPFRVSVKIHDDPERGKQNEVTGYLPRNAGGVTAPVMASPSPVMQQPVMAGANDSPF